jgi:deoxycytidine triphosphate deaminase
MALLTDVDIRRALKRKDIIIEDFDPDFLTPVGYDIRVGDWVASLTAGLLQAQDHIANGKVVKAYAIPPRDRVLVVSKEYISVSKALGGDFHTKVRLVARGLSSISTTLDPGYRGRLFITVTNLTDQPVLLVAGEAFTTLMFYRVETPTKKAEKKDADTLAHIVERLSADGAMPDVVKTALLSAPQTTQEDKETVATNARANRALVRARVLQDLRRGMSFFLLIAIILLALALLVVVGIQDPTNRTVAYIAFATTVITLCAGLLALRLRSEG